MFKPMYTAVCFERFLGPKEADHWIDEETFARRDVQAWLRGCRRKTPTSFVYTTYHPRYNHAYWVSIAEFGPRNRGKKITAGVTNQTIVVSVPGVKAVHLHRDLMPAELRALPVKAAGDLIVEDWPARRFVASPAAVCGPVKEAMLQPFIFISACPLS